MSIHFSRDRLTGAVETFDYDEADDLVILRKYCDVEPIIDANRRIQTSGWDGWTGPEKDMRLAARIPLSVAEMWLQDYGVDVMRAEHWPAVRRLLNSNEYQYLRTSMFWL